MAVQTLLSLQGMMALLMLMGVLVRKWLLQADAKAVLTELVIYIILPCNIISAFQSGFDRGLLAVFAVLLVTSSLIQLFSMALAHICYNCFPEGRKRVFQYATVCSNAGFMGNPVAEQLYGPQGLMYASVYLIPLRIVMWSAGVSYFQAGPSNKNIVRKVLLHPCNIGVYIGLLIMMGCIRLPGFMMQAVRSAGSCTTAVTMLLMGMMLAETDSFKGFFTRDLWLYSFIRLIFIPAVVTAGLSLFTLDASVRDISVILSGMPAGSTTAILAARYGGDYMFATRCIVVTTVLSLLTVPVWFFVVS